jgi:MFS family permease
MNGKKDGTDVPLLKESVKVVDYKPSLKVMYAIGFLCFADQTIIIPSVLQYMKQIMPNDPIETVQVWMSLTQTLFTLAQLVMTPIGATVFQKSGKMRTLMYTLVILMAVGNILYVLAAPGIFCSKYLVIVGRIIAGLGSGVSPLGYSYIAVTVPFATRGQVIANYRGFSSIASIAAPAIALGLDYVDIPIGPTFRLSATTSPTLVTALFCVIVAILIMVIVEEPDPNAVKAPKATKQSKWKLISLPVVVLVLIMIGNGYMNGSALFFVPAIFVEEYDWSVTKISLLNGGISLGVIGTVFLVKMLNKYPYMVKGYGEKVLLIGANLCLILGSVALALIMGVYDDKTNILSEQNQMIGAIICIAFLYLVFSTQSTVVPSLFSKVVPKAHIAMMMPLGVSGFQIGRLIAPFWDAWEVQFPGRYTLLFGFQAGLILLILIIYLITYRKIDVMVNVPRNVNAGTNPAEPPSQASTALNLALND